MMPNYYIKFKVKTESPTEEIFKFYLNTGELVTFKEYKNGKDIGDTLREMWKQYNGDIGRLINTIRKTPKAYDVELIIDTN